MEVKDITIPLRLSVFTFVILNVIANNKVDGRLIALVACYITALCLRDVTKEKYKNFVMILEGITTIILSNIYEPLAIILLIIVIIENLVVKIKNPVINAICIIIPLIFIKDHVLKSNILVIITIISIMYLFNIKTKKKMSILQKENEHRKKEINTLQKKLKNEREIREQYMYTLVMSDDTNIPEDVHTTVGQTMSGTAMQLEAIKLTINNREQCLKLLDIGINNLKSATNLLRGNIKEVGAKKAEIGINRINDILEVETKDTMFSYKLKHQGDLNKITSKQWILIENATRTLVDNSLSYSTGNVIEVGIEALDNIIRFEVKDDGNKEVPIIKGVGLKMLEEKVLDNNGQMLINSNNGFSVAILMVD